MTERISIGDGHLSCVEVDLLKDNTRELSYKQRRTEKSQIERIKARNLKNGWNENKPATFVFAIMFPLFTATMDIRCLP